MNNDPIVAEVRKARKEILESYNGDWEAMMRDMMKRQWNRGQKVVSLGKRESQLGVAPNAYPLREQS